MKDDDGGKKVDAGRTWDEMRFVSMLPDGRIVLNCPERAGDHAIEAFFYDDGRFVHTVLRCGMYDGKDVRYPKPMRWGALGLLKTALERGESSMQFQVDAFTKDGTRGIVAVLRLVREFDVRHPTCEYDWWVGVPAAMQLDLNLGSPEDAGAAEAIVNAPPDEWPLSIRVALLSQCTDLEVVRGILARAHSRHWLLAKSGAEHRQVTTAVAYTIAKERFPELAAEVDDHTVVPEHLLQKFFAGPFSDLVQR